MPFASFYLTCWMVPYLVTLEIVIGGLLLPPVTLVLPRLFPVSILDGDDRLSGAAALLVDEVALLSQGFLNELVLLQLLLVY